MTTAEELGRGGEVDRLLARIRKDGVPLPPHAVLDAVEEPSWSDARGSHDWRRHVPPSVQEAWRSLSLCARLCVFETAELAALEEDVGASMVTGSPIEP